MVLEPHFRNSMGRNKKSTCRPIIDTRTKSSDESAFLSRKECMRESLSATEPLALPLGPSFDYSSSTRASD
jgi:hypothetical protein